MDAGMEWRAAALAVLLLLQARRGRGLCSYGWEPLPDLDGREGKNPLLTLTSSSRLECAFQCLSHVDCMSISYSPTSAQCLIHWPPEPSRGTSHSGMKTFRLTRCRKTCLDGWTLHECQICLLPVNNPLTYAAAGQQ